jgi:hypothetical protein
MHGRQTRNRHDNKKGRQRHREREERTGERKAWSKNMPRSMVKEPMRWAQVDSETLRPTPMARNTRRRRRM